MATALVILKSPSVQQLGWRFEIVVPNPLKSLHSLPRNARVKLEEAGITPPFLFSFFLSSLNNLITDHSILSF